MGGMRLALFCTRLIEPGVRTRRSHSAMKIDVNQNRDIAYWAEKLGVTRTQLIAAVAAAGPEVADVERKLRLRRTPRPTTPRREARRKLGFHSFD